jgi:lysyl-tRNA synthetase class 2
MSERQRMTSGVADNLRLRAAVLAEVRAFFEERGYLEVETPAMVPSPGLDLHLDAFAVRGGSAPRYLITSPEYQMKRLLAGGLSHIFQLARCFRRGERGRRHNPEFTMLEWYAAGASYQALMDETEALVRRVLERHGRQPLEVSGHAIDVAAPFERLTVLDAFARFADWTAQVTLELAEQGETEFFRTLVDRVEPGLARMGRPVWLYDYPASQASLARLRPDDARLCERFELYVGDLELCNGFGELTDAREQRARLERDQGLRAQRGLEVYPIDERFLGALEQGMPDASGNALGLDRLVALCAGDAAVDDVMTFPDALL